jgi:hypothetical protein
MRSDLGRLDAIAEILQVGSFLTRKPSEAPGAWRRGGILPGKDREYPMKVFRIAAVFALLVSPAYAQMPHVNLLSDTPSKTQEEKDADAAREKAYKDSLRKIPDAKSSSDPWGAVRSGDAPKAAAPAKPKTKTGSTAN